ncbi:helix-turn-helix domain-containing protein [Cysteiniphilum sp. JM-1]|uniref:helix-turn-helix domain-containing protein n=1 Tax=Cysteiniphilum sp. JM-1 TaxID=2610891 RepID=UPI001247AE05|nr:helix-turn-helix domain-containing protein [Cysteiniphilum sp. JM-1]
MPSSNQYGNSFEAAMLLRYQSPAKKVLLEFHAQQLSYSEISKITGFAVTTIRKWARKYNISFPRERSSPQPATAFQEAFNSNKLNCHNILSRRWG